MQEGVRVCDWGKEGGCSQGCGNYRERKSLNLLLKQKASHGASSPMTEEFVIGGVDSFYAFGTLAERSPYHSSILSVLVPRNTGKLTHSSPQACPVTRWSDPYTIQPVTTMAHPKRKSTIMHSTIEAGVYNEKKIRDSPATI